MNTLFSSNWGVRKMIFFSITSFIWQGWRSGILGRAKSRKSVIIWFMRSDSSTIISGIVVFASNFSILFLSNWALLLMIPKGFLISWETPAVISPMADRCSACRSFSSNCIRSSARRSMNFSPCLTTNRKMKNKIPMIARHEPRILVWRINTFL